MKDIHVAVLQGRAYARIDLPLSPIDELTVPLVLSRSFGAGVSRLFSGVTCLKKSGGTSGGGFSHACAMIENSGVFSSSSFQDVVIVLVFDPRSADIATRLQAVEHELESRSGRAAWLKNALRVFDPAIGDAVATLDDISPAVRSCRISDDLSSTDIRSIMFLIGYLTYAGFILSRHENMISADLVERLKSLSVESDQRVERLMAYTIQIERYFMSRSPSVNEGVRHLCNQIVCEGRYRERLEDQKSLTRQISDYVTVKSRNRLSRIQRTSSNLVTFATLLGLPLALFFGVFSISKDADVIRTGGSVVFDRGVILAGLTIVVAFMLLAFLSTYITNRIVSRVERSSANDF